SREGSTPFARTDDEAQPFGWVFRFCWGVIAAAWGSEARASGGPRWGRLSSVAGGVLAAGAAVVRVPFGLLAQLAGPAGGPAPLRPRAAWSAPRCRQTHSLLTGASSGAASSLEASRRSLGGRRRARPAARDGGASLRWREGCSPPARRW